MAQGNNSLTTYYAKRVIGDSAASSADKALLQTGANIVTDAWILYRNNRTPIYGIKYKYDSSSNADKLELYGGYQVSSTDTPTAWVQMNTGDTYILGKVGINYDPNTSGNNYYLVVNGTSLFTDEVSIKNEIYLLDDNSVVVGKFYVEQAGTTLTHGIARLDLGNNIDADEGGNSYGEIRLLGGSSDSVVSIQNRGSSILNVRAGIFNFYGSQYLTSSQFQQTLLVLGETLVDDVRTNTYPILEIVSSHSFTSGTEGYLTLCLGNSSSSTGTYYASNLTGRIQLYNSTGGYKYIYGTSDGIGTNGTITCSSGKIWIQGGSAAGGDSNRLTTSAGMPGNMQYNQGRRGTQIYANGIAFADPYNGNSNSDAGWIRHIETTSNSGTLEIAVGDDGNETIVCRQYNTSNNIARTATILDASGNTYLPGRLFVAPDSDVTTNSGSGSIVIGSTSDLSIGIDANEIMCRSSNAASTLYIQNEGGAVVVGAATTINSSLTVSGTIKASTGNATGGGVWIGDDGDIVDNNDGYCSMRFSYGVIVTAGNKTNGSRVVLRNTGVMELYPNISGNWNEGIRIHANSNGGWTSLILCGTDNTGTTGTSANSWSMHAYGGSFYLTKNGSSSGTTWLECVNNTWSFRTNNVVNFLTTSGGAQAIKVYSIGCGPSYADLNTSSYRLHVNGASYLNGNLTVTGAVSTTSTIWTRVGSGETQVGANYTGTGWSIYLYANGGTYGIYSSHGFVYRADIRVVYGSISGDSSYLVKKDITSLTEEDAKKLLLLNPVSYKYKDGWGKPGIRAGLIAEEVEPIINRVVDIPDNYDENAIIEYNGTQKKRPEPKKLEYSQLIPYLIKLAQIQQKEIDGLKLQLKQLQEK